VTQPEQQQHLKSKSSTPLLTTSKLFLGACIMHASAQLALLCLLSITKAQSLPLASVYVRMSTVEESGHAACPYTVTISKDAFCQLGISSLASNFCKRSIHVPMQKSSY